MPKKKADEGLAGDIKSLIAILLIVDEAEITSDTKLQEDLGADSIDAVELVMEMEECFHITISDEQGERLKTFQDVVTLVTRLVAEKKGKPRDETVDVAVASDADAGADTREGDGSGEPETKSDPAADADS